jgi:4-amino-4-deoxy-L-arabinose transferase-like glycosyltransferase
MLERLEIQRVKSTQNTTILILAILVAICMASRILFVGEYLEGWDSIDFALGLRDYDITYYQPHFPGYPVYMFFCWMVHLSTDNDTLALTMPGAVLGSVALVPLFYLAKRMFTETVAWVTVSIYMVNPLCWLQSEKALSDAVGLFFVILSSQLLFYSTTARRYAFRYLIFGSVALGLCLGVRLSYFPFIILWIYVLRTLSKTNEGKKMLSYGLLALFTGICIWLVPLLCFTGVKSLVINGTGFTFGHFSDWGGSVATSQNIFSRFVDFMWCLFCNGLGFWCYDTSLFRFLPSIIMGVGIVVYLRNTRFDFKTRFIAFYLLPYLVWVFFCQNLEKPRHVLPLIPVIIICISAGLFRFREFLSVYPGLSTGKERVVSTCNLFIGILIVSMCIISVRLVYTHKNEPVAQIQLLDFVEHNYDEQSTRVYCWETKRLFTYYAPLWDTRRARDINDLRYDVRSSLVTPEVILSTSKVNGINSITNNAKEVVGFKNDRYINNPYHELTLYRLGN